jgi:hypothetical protein
MRARLAITAWVVAGLAGLAGCGGDDGGSGYPAEAKRNFTTACERSSGGDVQSCRCALEKIEERLSYEEFKQEDAAIRRGSEPSDVVTDAIAGCSEKD